MKEDSSFRKWNGENNIVMSWFINSITVDIDENFMFYMTSRKTWNAAKQTYFDKENTSELYEIEGALHKLRQGDLSVTQYFNVPTPRWQQLDSFEL